MDENEELYRSFLVAQASLPPPPEPPPPPPLERKRRLDLVAIAMIASIVVVAIAAWPKEAGAPRPTFVTKAPEQASADDDLEFVVEETPAVAVSMAPFARPGESKPAPAPTSASLVAEANAALRRGDRHRARDFYQRALGLGGSDVAALTGLGDVARADNAVGDAITAYERAVTFLPTYLPSRLKLADMYWEIGRRDAAVAEYRAIRATFPTDVYPVRVFERTQ